MHNLCRSNEFGERSHDRQLKLVNNGWLQNIYLLYNKAMKTNTKEAWLGMAATLVVLASASFWEGFASLLLAFLMMISFSLYKNSHSAQKWQLRGVIYVVLALILGLLDWGAVNNLSASKSAPYWNYIVLGATLVLVYLTATWEQKRGKSNA